MTTMSFHAQRSTSFNPLPPPKRGETAAHTEVETEKFNHTFQSTPPAEARGDRESRALLGVDRAVSIHSPRRSEGRLRGSSAPDGDSGVSIHSPRRSEGRPKTRMQS